MPETTPATQAASTTTPTVTPPKAADPQHAKVTNPESSLFQRIGKIVGYFENKIVLLIDDVKAEFHLSHVQHMSGGEAGTKTGATVPVDPPAGVAASSAAPAASSTTTPVTSGAPTTVASEPSTSSIPPGESVVTPETPAAS